MTFSLIFLTHTALLLGQGHLSGYGVNTQAEKTKCQNELFRSARIAQKAIQNDSFTDSQGSDLTDRIKKFCYHDQISTVEDALAITADE